MTNQINPKGIRAFEYSNGYDRFRNYRTLAPVAAALISSSLALGIPDESSGYSLVSSITGILSIAAVTFGISFAIGAIEEYYRGVKDSMKSKGQLENIFSESINEFEGRL